MRHQKKAKIFNGFVFILLIVVLICGTVYGWHTFFPGVSSNVNASQTRDGYIAYTSLPQEAQKTYQLILKNGPFPYEKDGQTFGNYEKRLPIAKRNYYREYTVKTPGVKHRGTRRIVCGGEQKTKPEKCYYTADHYASFAQIE